MGLKHPSIIYLFKLHFQPRGKFYNLLFAVLEPGNMKIYIGFLLFVSIFFVRFTFLAFSLSQVFPQILLINIVVKSVASNSHSEQT